MFALSPPPFNTFLLPRELQNKEGEQVIGERGEAGDAGVDPRVRKERKLRLRTTQPRDYAKNGLRTSKLGRGREISELRFTRDREGVEAHFIELR